MSWIDCIWSWIADHATVISAVISAFATAAIAGFTIKLTAATKGQLAEIRKTVILTQDEFAATHRPEIVIHSCTTAGQHASERRVEASVIYFNRGRSQANIIKINATIALLSTPLRSGIVLEEIAQFPGVVPSGARDEFFVTSTYELAEEETRQRMTYPPHTMHLVCIGCVVYEDSRHVKRYTGFCRRFDAVADRWERLQSDEYEYAY